MCDYSLEQVASRPAAARQQIIVTRFPPFMTRGFAEMGNPGVTICLLPGTEVEFEDEVRAEPNFPLMPKRRIGERLARFRQVNLEKPTAHHDAFEFANGEIVLVNRLILGQIATVLASEGSDARKGGRDKYHAGGQPTGSKQHVNVDPRSRGRLA